MMQVLRYYSLYKKEWDSFVDKCAIQSFLYKRDFIEYHADRYDDFSFIVIAKGRIIALCPANIKDGIVYSHQGLTYGGIIYDNDLSLEAIVIIIRNILINLKQLNVDQFFLKCAPRFYHLRPADELDWILFKVKAKLYRRDTALAIDNRVRHLPYQERRRRAIKKAGKNNIAIKQGFAELAPFWNEVLIPNLQAKHGVAPVHSLAEIELLASRFPENILQHTIYMDDTIVAGCTIFLNTNVAHAQYISGTELGRNSGCLDYLFDHLIRNVYASYPYFDFGICNEQNGEMINKGLLDWKEGFGARTIVHDFYEIDTASYKFLENYTT